MALQRCRAGLMACWWCSAFLPCAKCATVGTDEEPHMPIPQHLELAERNFQGAMRGCTGGYHREGILLERMNAGIRGSRAKV